MQRDRLYTVEGSQHQLYMCGNVVSIWDTNCLYECEYALISYTLTNG